MPRNFEIAQQPIREPVENLVQKAKRRLSESGIDVGRPATAATAALVLFYDFGHHSTAADYAAAAAILVAVAVFFEGWWRGT